MACGRLSDVLHRRTGVRGRRSTASMYWPLSGEAACRLTQPEETTLVSSGHTHCKLHLSIPTHIHTLLQEAREPPAGGPLLLDGQYVLVIKREDLSRLMAIKQEDLSRLMAIKQKDLSRLMAIKQEDLSRLIAIKQEDLSRLIAIKREDFSYLMASIYWPLSGRGAPA
ncbi:hypothetical protein PCANC_07389 [Puccinia coronata f. sp. avenae]|uniref:Uncharacterized protein n=1 Tax=Puccinia coronata f. sp. avenae TaxID=200324 RepID=A0A2N5T5C6_9BASI|nr:hypothetical protein PCANC_07389 [Puccinia coronata f. sp. avenae]